MIFYFQPPIIYNLELLFADHNGATNLMFMMAGYNDSDADSATTHLLTGGFKGSEHPEECLRFWYTIGVSRTCDTEKRDGWS